MIIAQNGNVKCKGTEPQLLAELTTIISALKEKVGIEKDLLEECFTIAYMSDEEINKEMAKEVEKRKIATLAAIETLTNMFGEEAVGEMLRELHKDK